MSSFIEIDRLIRRGAIDDAQTVLEQLSTNDEMDKIKHEIYMSKILEAQEDFKTSFDKARDLLSQASSGEDKLTLLAIIVESGTKLGKFDEIAPYIEEIDTSIQEDFPSDQKLPLIQEVEALRKVGMMYFVKGELSLADMYLHKALQGVKIINHKHELISVRNGLAGVQFRLGNLENSISIMEPVISDAMKIDNHPQLPIYLNNMGLLFHQNGQLEEAFTTLSHALDITPSHLEIENKARIFTNLGHVAFDRGDLDDALRNYSSAIQILQTIDLQTFIPYLMSCIGKIQYELNELDLAEEFLLDSKDKSNEVGVEHYLGDIYLALVRIQLQKGDLGKTRHYLDRLDELYQLKKDTRTSQLLRMGQAFYLKSQTRLADVVRAQQLFASISKEPIIEYSVTLLAQLNYCELLLLEFNAVEDIDILDEISVIFSSIHDTAYTYKRFPIIVHALILQSKIAMLSKNIEKVYTLLNEALDIAKEKKLRMLEQLVQTELDTFNSQVNMWNSIIKTNVSMNELVSRMELREYLASVSKYLRSSQM